MGDGKGRGDGLDISHGGALAVDTEELRAVGGRLRRLVGEVEEVSDGLRAAQSAADDARLDLGGVAAAVRRLDGVRDGLSAAARGTELMAEAYEIVELRARAELLRATDRDEAAALARDADRAAARSPAAAAAAGSLLAQWRRDRFAGFAGQTGWADQLLPGGRLAPGGPASGAMSGVAAMWLWGGGGRGQGSRPGVGRAGAAPARTPARGHAGRRSGRGSVRARRRDRPVPDRSRGAGAGRGLHDAGRRATFRGLHRRHQAGRRPRGALGHGRQPAALRRPGRGRLAAGRARRARRRGRGARGARRSRRSLPGGG